MNDRLVFPYSIYSALQCAEEAQYGNVRFRRDLLGHRSNLYVIGQPDRQPQLVHYVLTLRAGAVYGPMWGSLNGFIYVDVLNLLEDRTTERLIAVGRRPYFTDEADAVHVASMIKDNGEDHLTYNVLWLGAQPEHASK